MSDGEERETDMRMMGKSERKANDGVERETDMRMMKKSEIQTCK